MPAKSSCVEYWIGDMFSIRVYDKCPICKKTISKGTTTVTYDLNVECSDWICPDHGEIRPRRRWYFSNKRKETI